MAGKKYGLNDKYKALGVRERTIAINPMQDDLEKLAGMSAAGVASRFATRGITNIAKSVRSKPQPTTMDTVKKVLTSKTNIGATAGSAGYEIGKADNEEKTEGKKYGGSMKKMASGGMSKKEKKIKKVMGEYKKGELNIGKSKKKVKSRKQAIAIALSEARKKKA